MANGFSNTEKDDELVVSGFFFPQENQTKPIGFLVAWLLVPQGLATNKELPALLRYNLRQARHRHLVG